MRIGIAALLAISLAACSGGGDDSGAPTGEGIAQGSGDALAAAPAGFRQCQTCHAVEAGQNKLGPTLAGVFGAGAGHVAGFRYSSAMESSGLVWDEATLDAYLENPRKLVPGTTMSYAGIRDEAARKEVIEYLKTL